MPLFTIKQALLEQSEPVPSIDREFFQHLRLSNGSFKTTCDNRLNDVNSYVDEFLDFDCELKILDVAASSAISSVEWFAHLQKKSLKMDYTASDLTMVGRYYQTGFTDLLFEKQTGHLLQADILGQAFPSSSGVRWKNQIYRLLKASTSPYRNKGKEIKLVNRLAARCEQENSNFSLCELDMFQASKQLNSKSFNVIRAANILNRSYFTEAQIFQAIKQLFSLLDDGGFLIVVKSEDDGMNNGAVYCKKEKTFEHLGTINGGSDINELVRSAGRKN
ncbi:hypothetical protein MTBPR1_20064 [Candidatus Terasakiella magnetica]|uniref:Methyltransferase type 11 domain-containing protein n=1 Tax=Candidatus Terasakiella magnetica TaxID=1867952 RepID=A0A1C3RFZ2_9PROT|nr:hypothetical protein [Candidatus Terasakiella magnetica]SCA56216.1 hypothetical protein MTBPR1_20064 [Candidatus Terasakiella magnetica]